MGNLFAKLGAVFGKDSKSAKEKEYEIQDRSFRSQLQTKAEELLAQGYRETDYFAKVENNPDSY